MVPQPQPSPLIAGSVLPIKRAEELLATLPGIIAARIIANETGAVDEIHVLTSAEVTPKQTVRNIESALIAHLGMRVDHRKISVATTLEPQPSRDRLRSESNGAPAGAQGMTGPVSLTGGSGSSAGVSTPQSVPAVPSGALGGGPGGRQPSVTPTSSAAVLGEGIPGTRRSLYFEDVEVRRSRTKGITCRVTLKKGDQSFVGDSEGMENERSRIELAARAALAAIALAEKGEPGERVFALDGVKPIEAFDREFVFVGVTARLGRTSALLTGSCEVKESAETSSVLAVLDATNRWIAQTK
jgi:hypothetical protein